MSLIIPGTFPVTLPTHEQLPEAQRPIYHFRRRSIREGRQLRQIDQQFTDLFTPPPPPPTPVTAPAHSCAAPPSSPAPTVGTPPPPTPVTAPAHSCAAPPSSPAPTVGTPPPPTPVTAPAHSCAAPPSSPAELAPPPSGEASASEPSPSPIITIPDDDQVLDLLLPPVLAHLDHVENADADIEGSLEIMELIELFAALVHAGGLTVPSKKNSSLPSPSATESSASPAQDEPTANNGSSTESESK